MSATIHLHRWQHWNAPSSREHIEFDWHHDLSVAELVPDDLRGAPGLTVHVNGRLIEPDVRAMSLVFPGDHVDVQIRPNGPEWLVPALISAGISAAVSFTLSLILPKPKGPKKKGDEESANYAWSGRDNVDIAGQPRMLVLGETRVTPQVIDLFIHTTSVPPKSTLFMLLSFGEGPIHSIGGIEVDTPTDRVLSNEDPLNPLPVSILINGNPAENFDGIKAQVRLGTNEQEPIPGFEMIHTLSEVDQNLLQQETSSSSNAGTAWSLSTYPYNSDNAVPQAVWDEFAQTFTLPAAADQYVITIMFPGGLYRIDGSGDVQDAYFQAFVRYQELDGLGSPITTGGDNGDGWVYAYPKARLAAHHQSAFPYEIAGAFYSSAGFVAGQNGRILEANASDAYAYTASSAGGAAVNANTPWTAGQTIDEFTFECWYNPATLPLAGTGNANTLRPIFEWMQTTFRGFALTLERFTVDAGGDGGQQRWRLRAYWGDGSATLHVIQDAENVATGVNFFDNTFATAGWFHLAVTYKRNANGSQERWRIYVNGSMRREILNTGDELVAASASFKLCRTTDLGFGAFHGFGRMDETRVLAECRTSAQIVASYNGGVGSYGVTSTNLVAGWHFDVGDILTADTYCSSYAAGFTNNLTVAGSATVCASAFANSSVVFGAGSGTLKRAKYKVDVMRFNLVSTTSATQDESTWETIDGLVDEQLAYPHQPLLALELPATDQLSGGRPTVSVVVKGLLTPVWDGVSTTTPAIVDQWTPNPAWQWLLALTNRRFGRGGDFDFQRVDLPTFKELADRCDEKIYDGLGKTVILETLGVGPVIDLYYASTLFSGYGGIVIYLAGGQAVPVNWKIGRYLGFIGLPAPPTATILVDINTSTFDGFEIGAIGPISGFPTVTVRYDRATYGDPWADATFMSGQTAATVAGTVEGREERFRYDGVRDTFVKVWDMGLEIAGNARAVPTLQGRRVALRTSKPRSPVGLIGMASIIKDSFTLEYSSRNTRPNSYTADIWDRDKDYAHSPVERQDQEVGVAAPEGAFNREHIELPGVVRRSQALRDLDFRILVNKLLTRQGTFSLGMKALFYEPGDVYVLAHDLVPWGTSGAFAEALTGTTMIFDREVVLEADTTYYMRIRPNGMGQVGAGSETADYMEVREVVSGAGVYVAGAEIELDSAFTIDPAKDDEYIVYSLAQQFLAEIVEITMNPDFTRKVRWVQYDEDVYLVDELPQDIPLESALTAQPPGPERMPEPVERLDVRETQQRNVSGVYETAIHASWTLESTTAGHVTEVVVFARSNTEDSIWEEVARAQGPATRIAFRPPTQNAGNTIEFAVQAVSSAGARLHPQRCSRSALTLTGSFVAPPAPTNLQATMNGEFVTYTWDPPENARGLTYELRRGGWILGQLIGVAGQGSASFGPTRDWAASKANAAGDSPPLTFIRARDGRGLYSAAAVLGDFNPTVPGSEVLVAPNIVGQRINGDQTWEDYGTGWEGGSPAPTLTGLETFALASGALAMKFSGSDLTGTYETVVGTIDTDTEAEHAYAEAYVVADQIPPLLVDDWTLALDDVAASQRTIEGNLVSDTRCTLKIEWRYTTTPSGDYTEWAEFRPGVYRFLAPLFRVTVTRPSTDYQVRIYRFGTRLSRVAMAKFVATRVAQHFQTGGTMIG